MKRIHRSAALIAISALVLISSGQIYPAVAQAAFADPAFQHTWERTDKPVADHKADRSWYWGPSPSFSVMEQDKDAPGGQRLVQYFDKARMEINDPSGDKSSPFYVTNGLLATELMTGRLQVGNNDFEQRCASSTPLASDTDDTSAPSYATFGKLLGQPKSNQVGQKATAVTDKDGNLTADAGKAGIPNIDLVYFEPLTGRNIPKVFWDFLNTTGVIYKDGQFATGKVNDPWYFASGLPVTEAYWANVKIGGKAVDVLIQAYERRILTYIPSYIGTPFAVQVGNVGQHYYGWRYKGEGCAVGAPGQPTAPTGGPPAPTAQPTSGPVACDQGVPDAKNGTITPRCGPIGTVYRIHITGYTPDEQISQWLTLPDGQVFGTPHPLDAGHHGSDLDDAFDSSFLEALGPQAEGIWGITYQGAKSNNQSIVWFRVLPKVTAAPTAVSGTPAPAQACDTNGTKDATVSPVSGPKGTPFAITVTGFKPGETASFWLTGPDGEVLGTPQTLTIPSTGGGTLHINSGVLYAGRWALTIHGLTSKHESIGVFCIGP